MGAVNLGGSEPKFYQKWGKDCLRAGGQEYMVLEVKSSTEYLLGKDGIFGPTKTHKLYKDWGTWKVVEIGILG